MDPCECSTSINMARNFRSAIDITFEVLALGENLLALHQKKASEFL